MFIRIEPVMANDAILSNSALGRLLLDIEDYVLRPVLDDWEIPVKSGAHWRFHHKWPWVSVGEDKGDLYVDGHAFDLIVKGVEHRLAPLLEKHENVASFEGRVYLEGFWHDLTITRPEPEPEPEVVTLRTTAANLEKAREILHHVLGLEDGFEIVRGTE